MASKIVLYGCLGLLALSLGCLYLAGRDGGSVEHSEQNRESTPQAAPASAAPTPAEPVVGVDPDPPTLVTKATDLVNGLTKRGVLARWSCIGNEAYVRELLWDQFDIDAKRGIGRSLAVVCHAKKSGRYMTIKSYQTGKTLARFDSDELTVE